MQWFVEVTLYNVSDWIPINAKKQNGSTLLFSGKHIHFFFLLLYCYITKWQSDGDADAHYSGCHGPRAPQFWLSMFCSMFDLIYFVSVNINGPGPDSIISFLSFTYTQAHTLFQRPLSKCQNSFQLTINQAGDSLR